MATGPTTRKRISRKSEAEVLIRSRRRCCLCYFWKHDAAQKDGQLAHVDRNPDNASNDNLAYLCFEHHNQYDSTQTQGKSITEHELKHARAQLYRHLNAGMSIYVTVRMDCDENAGLVRYYTIRRHISWRGFHDRRCPH